MKSTKLFCLVMSVATLSACSLPRADDIACNDDRCWGDKAELISVLCAADHALYDLEEGKAVPSKRYPTTCHGCTKAEVEGEPDMKVSTCEDEAHSHAEVQYPYAPYLTAHWASQRGKPETLWQRIDLLSPFTAPVAGLIEILRWPIVEDADTIFRPTTFDSLILTKDGAAPLTDADEFEIVIRSLAVENLTEGRLRDSLGGQGAQLSLQVSLSGLTQGGNLIEADAPFLVTEVRKRRSALIAALKTNKEGREWVGEAEVAFGKAIRAVDRLTEIRKHLEEKIGKLLDRQRIAGLADGAVEQELEKLKALLREQRKAAEKKIGEIVKKHFSDQEKEVGAMAHHLVQRFFDQLEERLEQKTLALKKQLLKTISDSGKLKGWLDQVFRTLESVNDGLVSYLERYGMDDEGLFEKVEIIKGLANADRLTVMDFDGIRPALFNWGLDSPETAAYLLQTTHQGSADPGHASRSGVVYRGRIGDLSKLGEAGGFALSVLMLERDSDEIAKALRHVERYATEKDVSFSVMGNEVPVGPVADALALVAEQIAEDDVELKSLDLRFAIEPPTAGSNTGSGLFQLQPCYVLVTRNFHGAADFGAAALIEIRRVKAE